MNPHVALNLNLPRRRLYFGRMNWPQNHRPIGSAAHLFGLRDYPEYAIGIGIVFSPDVVSTLAMLGTSSWFSFIYFSLHFHLHALPTRGFSIGNTRYLFLFFLIIFPYIFICTRLLTCGFNIGNTRHLRHTGSTASARGRGHCYLALTF
jgi:hypothetical protein